MPTNKAAAAAHAAKAIEILELLFNFIGPLPLRRSSGYIICVAKKLSRKDTMQQRDLSSRAALVGAALGAMRRLATETDGLDQRAANRFGISRTDLQLIDRLRSDGPQTPSQLARSVGLTSGGLSIALERLERVGYIHRSQHPDDRRSVLVQATDAVVPIENEVFGPLIREMQSLLDSYDDRELATIREFLDRAAAVTSQAGPGASPSSDQPSGPPRPARVGRRSQRELPGPR